MAALGFRQMPEYLDSHSAAQGKDLTQLNYRRTEQRRKMPGGAWRLVRKFNLAIQGYGRAYLKNKELVGDGEAAAAGAGAKWGADVVAMLVRGAVVAGSEDSSFAAA